MHSKTFKTALLSAGIVFAMASHGGVAIASGSHGGGHGAAGMEKGAHVDEHGGDKSHGHAMESGEPGDPAKVNRTITVVMGDNYFEPEVIKVRRGETIRFIVRNEGEFLHEFNIGTAAMHAAHQAEMAEMAEHGMITATGFAKDKMKMEHGDGKMAMDHDDPNSVLLEPGKQREIVWRFTQTVDLEYACNVPGHYEAGMVGPIQQIPARPTS